MVVLAMVYEHTRLAFDAPEMFMNRWISAA